MGTIKTAVDGIRLRTRDKYKAQLSDDDITLLINGVLAKINNALRGLECVLAYTDAQIPIVTGEDTITPSFEMGEGLVWGNVFIEGAPLYLLANPEDLTATGKPVTYYTKGKDIIVNPIPAEAYTMDALYWLPNSVIDVVTEYDNGDLPYDGIWDTSIMYAAVIEGLIIRERDIGAWVAVADASWEWALGRSLQQGVIKRSMQGMYVPLGGSI